VPVHHVEPDEQGNSETRLVNGKPLHLPDVVGAHHVEQVSDGAVLDCLRRVARDDRSRHGIARGGHGQLTEFFGQSHLPNESIDCEHSILGVSSA
jgi:hypothetical protein